MRSGDRGERTVTIELVDPEGYVIGNPTLKEGDEWEIENVTGTIRCKSIDGDSSE